MIDAYEIGIQLALQDGVSAGLDAIGRDLAEVDRAIAATTAGLQGLTLAAQMAVREGAAVGGMRPGAAGGQAAGIAEASPEAAALQREASRPPSQEAVPEAQRSVLPVSSEPERSLGPIAPTRPAAPEAAGMGAASQAAPVAAEVAPASPSTAPVVAVQQRVSVAEVGAVAAAVPVASVQMEPIAAPTRSGADGSAAALVPVVVPRQEFASPTRAGARERIVTASVSKAMADTRSAAPVSSTAAATGEYRDRTATQPAGRVSSAAWVGSPGQGRAPSQMVGGERAAAPQPQVHEGGEGMSGTVVLDGRMVGYWMSDQMAKEASKPPGGTTFFDPRQSPAWNASGAL